MATAALWAVDPDDPAPPLLPVVLRVDPAPPGPVFHTSTVVLPGGGTNWNGPAVRNVWLTSAAVPADWAVIDTGARAVPGQPGTVYSQPLTDGAACSDAGLAVSASRYRLVNRSPPAARFDTVML